MFTANWSIYLIVREFTYIFNKYSKCKTIKSVILVLIYITNLKADVIIAENIRQRIIK